MLRNSRVPAGTAETLSSRRGPPGLGRLGRLPGGRGPQARSERAGALGVAGVASLEKVLPALALEAVDDRLYRF